MKDYANEEEDLLAKVREPPKPSTSTNPSKRHRERLNGELETVAALLPYDAATISRLDKLSVLRLAVSYLQVKAHFHACLTSSPFICQFPLATHTYPYCPQTSHYSAVPTICHSRTLQALIDPNEADFETIALKSLGGFLLIINDNGEIYYASENIEQFLGFHQSDVLHQPLYDLIHSEDRDDIRQQLNLTYSLPPGSTNPQDLYDQENAQHLERNVNARFRCLLDNTCGFLRIDMRGKLLSLHGLPSSYVLGRSNPGPVVGLITVCTPFVPPSTADVVAEDQILKTKHQLDGTLVSMDDKVHAMLELNENELPKSFYSLVHVEDAVCLAEAHKEVIKNGSSGLLIYRLISTKTNRTYYVQSSCRMFYKNGKPESIGLTHRLLNEVEGSMLLEKRSSLKAKLLSFDDSFLQSPRNLQSTAALPLPSARDDTDGESPFATPLPIVARQEKKNEFPIFPHGLMPKVDSWPLLQPPLQEFGLPLGPPIAGELPPWTPDPWTGELYHHYQAPLSYQASLQPLPRPSYHDLAVSECQHWNPNGHHSVGHNAQLANMEDSTQLLMKDISHGYPLPVDYNKVPMDYPMPAVVPPQPNGFHLISEVTNTLLGQ
ncbi:unnamed protein product [Cylicocyclus nassatus]|uniref:Aryl hydrocarbon receptor n=1 Tax=Cylicocyclus nassatus TaxID=53992 RepID=A0AA36GL71_CYLNA|nr:unnamed protein product [Cylicocyclus nassatus]